jgi:hypothetical protein
VKGLHILKRITWLTLAILITFLSIPTYAASDEPFKVDVFFWDEYESCFECPDYELPLERTVRILVRRIFAQVIDDGLVAFNYHNLFDDENFNAMLSDRSIMAGVDIASIEMPIFFTQDNHSFGGDEAVANLQAHMQSLGMTVERANRAVPDKPEGALVSPRHDDPADISVTDSVVVYFYTPWCPFCYEIESIMDNLPEYVMIDGQKSYVRLVSYNRDIPEHHDIIWAYHEMLEIPETRRFVPLVLIGDRNLFLYGEVSRHLLTALEAGEGLATPLFHERMGVPKQNGMSVIWLPPIVAIGMVISITIFYAFKNKNA